jgi:3-methylcrotonyl-CoA carboxylase beta subunit
MAAPGLRSLADPASEGFQRNLAEQMALVAELRARLATAARGGPEGARERHAGRGKLLPGDRVDALADPASPFLEPSPLAANGMYGDEAPAAGQRAGRQGRPGRAGESRAAA